MGFAEISIVLVVASVFAIVAKTFKQPLLIGYLFAGIFLAITGVLSDGEALSSLGRIGVTLLLFLVGLEMNIRELPTIGKVALYTGIGQIIFTSTVGFLISLLLGFGVLPSVYIAVALTFSSTIIMVKLLSEKNDLDSLYGRIAIGFLLVQDFMAILILMFLAGLKTGNIGGFSFVLVGIKALILFVATWFLSKKFLPNFFEKFVSKSPELVFIVSTAWALGVATLVAGPLGFTLEIGGFLAGLALSNLPEHLEIVSKTRPLRDFFLVIFFLFLGTQLTVPEIGKILVPGVVFSLFVLIGNPIIVLIIMGFMGYKKRTSFMAGLTVAQISEFSFILVAMGASLGHVGSDVVALVVLVGLVTMTISTYFILESEKIYSFLKNYLSIFERNKTKEIVNIGGLDFSDHVILVGCDRTGRVLKTMFKKKQWPYVVIDFNPKVFARLSAEKSPVIFGDVGDPEILSAAGLDKAKLVVSTISNLADDLVILEKIRKMKNRPVCIFTAKTRQEAIKLYEKGATYVIVPEIVAGEHLRHIFRVYGLKSERLIKIGKGHFNRLLFR